MAKRLTKKQKEFADEYVKTGNGTKAALKTYETSDYSTASVIAAENLDKPKIRQYLDSHADMARKGILELAQKAGNEQVRLAVQGNGNPKLFVSEVCENTIWEFETYRYDPKQLDDYETNEKNAPNDPLKLNDHAMDALRYVMLEYARPEQTKPISK